MKRILCLPILAWLALLVASVCLAQPAAAKKTYMFHGKVEAVNASSNTIRVNGEEVKGWMAAMTMDYKDDNPAGLQKVKAGDRIMATVYEGDLILHKVQVMPSGAKGSKKK